MARYSGQKLKILYILQLLEDESSETSPVSTARLIAYLEEKGIHADRKTIYDDMESLQVFGYEIIKNSNRCGGGYYLGKREFELPELKLLVDAVQASRFITVKKSRELISKLEDIAGKRADGKQLRRQVHVVGRAKTENESIYYSIDAIHRAISQDCQISFQYLEWNAQKKLVPRTREVRIVSPWVLIWQLENYYLVAYDESAGEIRHFRVDKMGKVGLLERKRLGRECYEKLDLATYTNQTFGMFGGELQEVTLRFPGNMIGVVIDRFGKDVPMKELPDGSVQVRTRISVSGQFFGWMAGLGSRAKIVRPDSVREDYRSWLERILKEV